MKKRQFSTEYISFLCAEIRLILKAGISLDEAFSMMAAEESNRETKKILEEISERIAMGDPLQDVFVETGRFPKHMTDMISMGYATGYLEEVFAQLAKYYDRETRLRENIKSAVTYPAVLMIMMVCVILILIIKVLPVFKSVFDQLGGSMSGLATVLMNIGVFLGNHVPAVLAVIVIIAAVFAAMVFKSRKKGNMTVFMTPRLQHMAGAARFAAALSMAASSGLSLDEAVNMAAEMDFDKVTKAAIVKAKASMEEGQSFAETMRETGLFSNTYNRMIALAYKSGNIDSVLEEIAERMDSTVNDELDALVGMIEPTMVIILSLITGAILLSVMLPLMGIMNAIG
jgi:type IV pilus assembly protein PilC